MLLPENFIDYTVKDLQNLDREIVFPIDGNDLKVRIDRRIFISPYACSIKNGNIAKWFIVYRNGKYLLYSSEDSEKIRLICYNLDEKFYIELDYAGHLKSN